MLEGKNETIVTMDTSSVKFGPGVTQELGFELTRLGVTNVMLVTDPVMSKHQSVDQAILSIQKESIKVKVFDKVRVEPTDESFKEAIRFAIDGKFDGYVAVGGGSSIDTAKAANLYATYPADFLEYVNAPIGKAVPVPGPLKPLFAIPTTSGTGSETTGVSIFDFLEMKAKTGISSRALRPVMGLVDPLHTKTLPGMVVASSGLDVLCHGLESYTALPYQQRHSPDTIDMRPTYQGSNPISDVWSIKAVEMVGKNIVEAVQNPLNHHARTQMILAATFAGIGFGNAGCHLPHGMSYPISGMVKDFIVDGYPGDSPLIPHGISVILTAPAVFRYTALADPQRHLEAASAMGFDTEGLSYEDAGEALAQSIINIIRQIGVPNGLEAVGYTESDLYSLVNGTLPQKRVVDLSPRLVNSDDIYQILMDSMKLW
tara:strand:+ start:3661 stop:4947 length:1287 start_codon:yes stop_codon:yes gene_type:complete